MSNLSGKKFYVINLDLRHWFFQMKLPKRYRPYLGIKVPGRMSATDFYYLFPYALPMGWLLAPFIAQCMTWGLVLSRPRTSYDQKGASFKSFTRDADLDQHGYMRSLSFTTRPPTWIPLLGGGGIFVFLDNILIITPRLETANFWFEKMVYDCEDFKAHLKGCNMNDPVEKKFEDLKKECFHVMEPYDELDQTTATSFTFLGVTWYSKDFKVEVRMRKRTIRFCPIMILEKHRIEKYGEVPDETWPLFSEN